MSVLMPDVLVMVASNRISAFDVVLPRPIPGKGQVLNQIAEHFLEATKDIVPNWRLATPDAQVTIGHRAEPFKVEMVIRGYLAGHAARLYNSGKRLICGVKMPDGMIENDKFPFPIITPTTKALDGNHDEDISKDDILKTNIVSKEDYLKVIKGKTSALFSAACQAGGEITEASDPHIEALRSYGECVGTSFQLIDDLLDYLGNENQMGKDKGNDFFEKKITLPIIHAYEKSSKAEKRLIKEILQMPTPDHRDFNNFLEILENKKSLLFTKNQAAVWTERSISALDILENSEIKTLMIGLAEEILDRVSYFTLENLIHHLLFFLLI